MDQQQLVEEGLDLYRQVFPPKDGELLLYYGNREVWISKLVENNGKIFVVKGKGFLFTYHRQIEVENDNYRSIIYSNHIWLAGVIENARNQGIMKSLFCQAVSAMVEDPQSPPLVTIRTGPKFHDMESWIQRLGFSVRIKYEGDLSTLYEISPPELMRKLGIGGEGKRRGYEIVIYSNIVIDNIVIEEL